MEQKISSQTHVRGVKNESVLNESMYFHVAENMMVDLLHIFPEGIISHEVGSVLFVYTHFLLLIILTTGFVVFLVLLR